VVGHTQQLAVVPGKASSHRLMFWLKELPGSAPLVTGAFVVVTTCARGDTVTVVEFLFIGRPSVWLHPALCCCSGCLVCCHKKRCRSSGLSPVTGLNSSAPCCCRRSALKSAVPSVEDPVGRLEGADPIFVVCLPCLHNMLPQIRSEERSALC
jgi:hypothetical protein